MSEKLMPQTQFYDVVNGCIVGGYSDYNVIELLNKGKVDMSRYYIAEKI